MRNEDNATTNPQTNATLLSPDPSGTPTYAEHPNSRDPAVHSTSLTVRRMYKESGGIVVGESHEEHPIEIQVPVVGLAMASVGASSRMTLNMGNYESVQLEVNVVLPCYVEEVDSCYKTAKQVVDLHLNSEIAAIRTYRSEKSSAQPHEA